MTSEIKKYIRDLLHADTSYLSDKQKVEEIVDSVRDFLIDKEEVFNQLLTETAIKLKWSRRKLDALIDEMLPEVGDDMVDLFLNYLDGLEGNSSWAGTTKLYGDPEDIKALYYFVRGLKWIHQDYYSSE